MRLTFLGAAGTVTGSKYLLETADTRILIDCGLFQGPKALREKNWQTPLVGSSELHAVVLTHAHIDHSGYLPRIVKEGYSGPIYATPGTTDLCRILLPDCGMLMEEDARFANKYGFSRHQPALPLFGREEAEATLKLFKSVPFHEPLVIRNSLSIEFFRAGHILGASYIRVKDLKSQKTILFSGDIGRDDDPITLPPEVPPASDTIVMESTYGNRLHGRGDVSSQLAELINATARRGGTVVIPVFAVGRSQLLMHYLTELRLTGRIPHLPVFLDSPMATNASEIYCRRTEEHRLTRDQCMRMCEYVTYVRSVEESKQLTREKFPKVILSANGMATGGRILHHIKAYGVDPRNSLLFVGYQSPETRGAKLLEGQREIKIHGSKIEIRAAVHAMDDLSAHADQQELLKWIRSVPVKPQTVFLTHGEPQASQVLAECIRSGTAYETYIPALSEAVEL